MNTGTFKGADGADAVEVTPKDTQQALNCAPLPVNVTPTLLLAAVVEHGASARYDTTDGAVKVKGYRSLPEHLQRLLVEHRTALIDFLMPRDLEVELQPVELPLPVEVERPIHVEPVIPDGCRYPRPKLVQPTPPPKKEPLHPRKQALYDAMMMETVRRVVPSATSTHDYLASQGAPWSVDRRNG